MPAGYLTGVAIIALYTVFVLWPPSRPAAVARAIYVVSDPVNDLPFIPLAALLAGTALALADGDLASAGGVVPLGVAALTALGLLEIARRGWLAGAVVQRSLDRDLGREWHSVSAPTARSRSLRLVRAVLAPFPARPRTIKRVKDIAYGEAGKRNQLDVYHRRDRPAGAGPVLIHFHGGHFQMGAKSREPGPCCTGWRARAGCASAPTTAFGPPGGFRTRSSTPRR